MPYVVLPGSIRHTLALHRTARLPAGLSSCFVLLACELARDSGPPDAAPDFFSVHGVVEDPGPDARLCEILGTGDTIAVQPLPVVGLTHMDSARVRMDPRPFVTVFLTPEGSATLAEATRAKVGLRLAIGLDGRVVAMPLITTELRSNHLPPMPQADTAPAPRPVPAGGGHA